MTSTSSSLPSFREMFVIEPVLKALNDVGYETPSPIQAQTIPLVFECRDVIGQAQTGTGKTAAFALPLLSRINLQLKEPQVLVLVPTRELAIQVSEAFQRYAQHLKGFHVMPIYGGQDYEIQLRQLKRGVHVVVGTAGRLVDHLERKTLKLDSIQCVVLDEADEMLRMGFIEQVEWIMEQMPEKRQVVLFSATMPVPIRRIAKKYMKDPAEITIKVQTSTADNIRQRYWIVSEFHKLDTLTRILEAESFDGMIIFVRTKTATLELAEKLDARGYSVVALNGDIVQKQRERTIDQLKKGKFDILVATDVAARGLDVERISHVINYDVPYDSEAYIHRVGRTGRAGRSGEAIMFVAPREKHLLRDIEKAVGQPIELLSLPSTEMINDKRISAFKQRITDTIAEGDLDLYTEVMEQYQREHNVSGLEIAAALAKIAQGDKPLLLEATPALKQEFRENRKGSQEFRENRRGGRDNTESSGGKSGKKRPTSDVPMVTYRMSIGRKNGIKPGNIVGAIANEANLESRFIGDIKINETWSTVELPADLSPDVLQTLKKVRVSGLPLKLSKEVAVPRRIKKALPEADKD
ncbi:MAG: DEAD/DEAH box helicase [SAR324 cluster bacterium]|nr:DEAD/DEAH box helicase [SAR324 cluster bacterium]